MGWNFRRSIKIAPGIRLNFSNRGMGYSIGPRGNKLSVSPTGRVTRSVGIPGTGIRYTKVIGSKSRSSNTGQQLISKRAPVPFLGYVLAGIVYTCVRGLFTPYAMFTSNPIAPNDWQHKLLLIAIAILCIIGFVALVRTRWHWNKAVMEQNRDLENRSN